VPAHKQPAAWVSYCSIEPSRAPDLERPLKSTPTADLLQPSSAESGRRFHAPSVKRLAHATDRADDRRLYASTDVLSGNSRTKQREHRNVSLEQKLTRWVLEQRDRSN